MPDERLPREPGQHYVEELSSELRRYGLDSGVITSGVWPRLRIHLPYAAAGFADTGFEDNVLAVQGADGRWSYWWPWIEEICEAGDAVKAAEIVVGVLGIAVPRRDEEEALA